MANKREIALHEAGHAVMSYYLKRGIEFVEITPDNEEQIGLCKNTIIWSNYTSPEYEDPKFNSNVRRIILILLAGFISEQKEKIDWQAVSRDCLEDAGAGSDIKKAFDMAYAVCGYSEAVSVYMEKLWNQAKEIITQPLVQQQIEVVADALCQKGKLSGAEVRRIIKNVE